MGYAQYRIEIIRKNLTDHEIIQDFKSLKIIDILNEIGTWSITSITEDPCPFTTGDFIKVYRDKVCVFGGCLTSFEEEYSLKKKAWEWKASGKSLNQLLKWKVIFPQMDFDSGGWYLDDREDVYDNDARYVILKLIENNVMNNDLYYRAGADGFDVVHGATDMGTGTVPYNVETNYRFDNVFEAVSSLVNTGNFALLPVWIKDDGKDKVEFYLTNGNDVSSTVKFRSEFDHINTFRHVYTCPDATDIVMSFNADDDDVWRYVKVNQMKGASDWRANGQIREVFVKPKKEDFNETFTKAQLDAICESTADGMDVSAESYEVELNVLLSPYVYGYDINIGQYSETFTNDYRLGDVIGFVVNGETYTGKLTKMEFDVSYGRESIRPSIGGISKGAFNGILSNVGKLNKSITKTDNTEVA